MKQQRIARRSSKKAPLIIDERQPKSPPPIEIDPAKANLPIRTIIYLEVGDMEPVKVQYLIQEMNKVYADSRGGIHYIIPIRNGKIGTDIAFEAEFERVVQEICEIHEGNIRLKGGAKECYIVRQTI